MGEVVERLTMMNERFGMLKQVQEIMVYHFVIVFMMGMAFVIFGFYIGQEHKLSLYKETLSDFIFRPRHPRYNNTHTIPD